MALTDTEKVNVRRYCGFKMFGGRPVQAFEHRFYTHYGTLEFRMNNMLDEEETQTRAFLTTLATLEAAIPTATDNLDTDEAAVWKHNKDEVRDRMNLYRTWRMELCNFMGVSPGPGLQGQGGIQLVV
jgi:hypothetical protein